MSIISRGLRTQLVIAAVCVLFGVPAFAEPVFGPQVYTQTASNPTAYSDQVNNATSRIEPFVFWFQNGDDGGSQVADATVTVNGKTVASQTDFTGVREVFAKYVWLNSGENTINVTMTDPNVGSYFTLVVLPTTDRFDIIVGRLLLPNANASTVLELKNGSHGFARFYRAHFYSADGTLAATSDRLSLNPRASNVATASSLITSGSWSEGSVEIFYAGKGGSRLFGQAATTDSGISSVIPIQHAGARRRDPYKPYNQE